jgi:hypothetical protein
MIMDLKSITVDKSLNVSIYKPLDNGKNKKILSWDIAKDSDNWCKREIVITNNNIVKINGNIV